MREESAALIKDFIKYDKRVLFGCVILLIVILISILSLFSPYKPDASYVTQTEMPPSFKHLLGTNSLGQDIFWKATYAIRNSFLIGVIAGVLGVGAGTLVGLLAGYTGRTTDRVISSLTDTFIVVPSLPILILFGFILGGQMSILLIAALVAMFSWAIIARQVRAQALSLREREFTYTAIFSGMGIFKILFKEHLPFVTSYAIAQFINTLLSAIGAEVTLAIFGLSNLQMPTLGTMIYWSNRYQAVLRGIWWWFLTPVTAAIVIFIGLYMLSTGISEFLDPRTRLQRIKIMMR
ncbi:MAG: ABC transporter permease [Synergistetes bacterium]|nr:ABC transporter permease [Synergistota bacterium]